MKAFAAFLLVLCCLAVTLAWNCNNGPRLNNARQIDAGMGHVVATDRYSRAYFLSGRAWYRLGTYNIQHVTVGPAGTWGTYRNRVYKFASGNFKAARGVSMMQVDAGGAGQLVGVGPRPNRAYCLRKASSSFFYGVGALPWYFLRRVVKYYSCGPVYGCWSIDRVGRVIINQHMAPNNCRNSGWAVVSGPRMTMIEVGADGNVFGVTTTGKIYQRVGISIRRKAGTTWRLIPVCMRVKHVSYDLRQLWAVTTAGVVMRCT